MTILFRGGVILALPGGERPPQIDGVEWVADQIVSVGNSGDNGGDNNE